MRRQAMVLTVAMEAGSGSMKPGPGVVDAINQVSDQAPERLTVVHLAEMGDLVGDHVVHDPFGRHE